MTVRVNQESFNIREKLTELGRRFGIKGSELAAVNTTQEARDLVSAGRKNLIINGAMMVDQRNSGASATPTGSYTYFIDRYAMWYSVGSGHTIQQVSDSPAGFGNSFQLTVGTGGSATGTEYGRITYSIEGYDALPLELGSSNVQAFTVSFYVKISVAGTYGVQLHDGSNATIKYQSSFSISGGDVNNWVRRSFIVPAGTFTTGTFNKTNGEAMTIAFDLGEGPDRSVSLGYHDSAASGALGLTGGTKILETSGATYQFTGLQLELGKNATDFEHRSYGEELALCERYFQFTVVSSKVICASSTGPTTARCQFPLSTKMRVGSPTFFNDVDQLVVFDGPGNATTNLAINGITFADKGVARLQIDSIDASGTFKSVSKVRNSTTTSTYDTMGLNAEL